jgi:hypothetical protein
MLRGIRLSGVEIAAALLAASLVACGEGASDGSGDGVDTASAGDYLEAVPDGDQLDLTLDEDGTAEQALSEPAPTPPAAEEPEPGPARIRALAHDVFQRINDRIHDTRDRIREAMAGVEPETLTVGGFQCKRWEKDGERAHWRFTSCRRDAKNRVFAFKLEGRPLDGTDDDLLTVFAGEGRIIARFDDKKRGSGRVGYDLDNLNELTGEGPTGKIGIGYRAVGKVRQLEVGLHELKQGADDVGISARYSYRQEIGKGGHVKLKANADLVTRDDDGNLVLGQDGTAEKARVALSWKHDKGARAAVALCDGTVGEGECVHLKQCWSRDDRLQQDDLSPDAGKHFDRGCDPGDGAVNDEPSESDVSEPAAGNGDIPGPAVQEPGADPAEG